MSEHEVSYTDELVTKRYDAFPGTVARCICGWKSSWTTRDGSAEEDGAHHVRMQSEANND